MLYSGHNIEGVRRVIIKARRIVTNTVCACIRIHVHAAIVTRNSTSNVLLGCCLDIGVGVGVGVGVEVREDAAAFQ